ncbi:MAG: D-alanyl-D-alanine carboxypeptidase/D-alanyl-D-alanine-endopeptidase [Firmicutes bacterium]|nr:D-alanyl-D-alanine carboxypeptidase/D-alanyl-D-alanine-endopeptidase [Bacillota bacterium]
MGWFRTRWAVGILVGLVVELALPHFQPELQPHLLHATTPNHASSAVPAAPRAWSLQAEWQALAHSAGLVHATVSATAYDITGRRLLAAVNPETLVTPGSVVKLFTSAAALAALGPDFRYQTRVMVPEASSARGHPLPIYLVGDGNPWLEANGGQELEALAKTVARQVRTASRVEGYAGAYPPPGYGLGWPLGELDQNYAAATSALMVERSEVTVSVTGSALPGRAPTVSLAFNGPLADPSYFQIVNRARTVAGMRAATIRVVRILGTNRIVVSGDIPTNGSAGPFDLSVGNPARFAAALFEEALAEDGVHFTGPASIAAAPPAHSQTLAVSVSPPLSQLLALQNQYSINQMADNLYRAVGLAVAGNGSWSAARQAVDALLNQAKIPANRVQVDGSGLSPLDELSSEDVVALLRYAAKAPWFSTFQQSLIQIDNPSACGFLCPPTWTLPLPQGTRVWVKPGNLANQWNLAGYVETASHQLIAFAILDDGPSTAVNATPYSAVTKMLEAVAHWSGGDISAAQARQPSPPASLPPILEPWVENLDKNNPGLTLAIDLVNMATGKTLYAENATTLVRAGLAPRVILADVALERLGASLPPVRVLAAGTVQHHVLYGSLILEGNDNDVNPAELRTLGQRIKARGIVATTGPLEYVNAEAGFTQERWPGRMPWNDVGRAWAPPASSLYVSQDVASLHVEATEPGHPARVSLTPAATGMGIENAVTTSAAGTAHITVTVPFHQKIWQVSGSIPQGSTWVTAVAPPDAGAYAANTAASLFQSDGLAIPGDPRPIPALPPSAHVIATLPGNSVAVLAQDLLTSPSLAPANQLVSRLGPHLAVAVNNWTSHAPVSVSDWEGASLDNYLTASGLAQALCRQFRLFPRTGLTELLARHLWISSSPEVVEILGYIPGAHHTWDAVSILASGLRWNGRWTPTITWGANAPTP